MSSWDYRIIKSNRVLLRPFCQVSELLIIPTWIRGNHSAGDTNRHAEAALSKAYGNIRARQERSFFFFRIYSVRLLWRLLLRMVDLVRQNVAGCHFDWTFYCANQSLWGEQKRLIKECQIRNKKRWRECALAGKNGGFVSGKGASVTDTFRTANKWTSHENSVISCWCCSWGSSPRCRLSRIDLKNRRIIISPGCFKMLNASCPVCLCAPPTLLWFLPTSFWQIPGRLMRMT